MALTDIPDEMEACQVVEFHKPYVVHKIPTPKNLKGYEILIKTAVASLCHTDFMVMEGYFPTPIPCTGSHEGSGVVVAVGPKVDNFKPGDRVMSGMGRGRCGDCIECNSHDDQRQYCQKVDGYLGILIDGAFADYHISDSRTTAHLPDSVSFLSAAPLACAGTTVYRTIIMSNVKEGGWLAIVGAGGGLGHLGIQFALARGINVVAIDARDEGLALCNKAGAKVVLDARKGLQSVVKAVHALTDNRGVEATINLSDHDTAAATGCAVTRMHGTMIQVAQPDVVNIPFKELVFRDIRVIGTLGAGQEVTQAMVNDVAKYNIQVEVNKYNGLKEIPKMVELAHSGKMKGKAVCVVDESLL
ncbi:alcohol dehydrogenase [Trichoderma sp. SZMC 28011]